MKTAALDEADDPKKRAFRTIEFDVNGLAHGLLLHHFVIALARRHERPDVFRGVNDRVREAWAFGGQQPLDRGADVAALLHAERFDAEGLRDFHEIRLSLRSISL